MSEELVRFEGPMVTTDGRAYEAIACGRERENGSWEGWIEFAPLDGSPRIRTERETTQPDYQNLLYWATGLTATYLDGALLRATRVPPVVEPQPHLVATAPPRRANRAAGATLPRRPANAVLNPFAVWAEGDEVLRDQLGALGPAQLRNIVRAYALTSMPEEDLELASPAELRTLILTAVRDRSSRRA